jgi:hypothetical protein
MSILGTVEGAGTRAVGVEERDVEDVVWEEVDGGDGVDED